MPDDPELVTASGPYMISDFVADQYVTLTANPEYKGDNAANIEEITVRFIPDPLAAAQALENGEVDVISPQATADLKTAVDAIDSATVITGSEGTYEHIDLQFENAKNPENIFKDPKVREAFLKTIPRQEIVDKLIVPIAGDDAQLRSSQIFVPGAEGSDESVANNSSANFAEVDIPGATALLAESGRHQPRGVHPVRVEQPPSCERVRPDPGIGQSGRLQRHRLRFGRVGWPARHARRVRRGLLRLAVREPRRDRLDRRTSRPEASTTSASTRTLRSTRSPRRSPREFDKDKQIALMQEADKLLWEDFFGVTIFQFPGVTAYSDRVTNISPSILVPDDLLERVGLGGHGRRCS